MLICRRSTCHCRLSEVNKIVNDVDPSGAILTIRENEYDIKIYTKAKLSGRIFNKGHGVRLIERKMGVQLQDEDLITILQVTKTCAQFNNSNVTFVSCPEVLLGAMAQATVRELKMRGGDLDDDNDI
ncbi:hypothetical protein DICVIV_12023 [Dictyocaulus viviparus]|uniref:Trehalose-6-phosphate phosphatase C-terminal domain-containing protein n=1 Tax=Dictyocaulus viviparus TaxID=29172 RepID=A0A0D8XBN3_DICVI|nr:hypothetical protein DICVIV_12023 [Dictyocaulus viviparus]